VPLFTELPRAKILGNRNVGRARQEREEKRVAKKAEREERNERNRLYIETEEKRILR